MKKKRMIITIISIVVLSVIGSFAVKAQSTNKRINNISERASNLYANNKKELLANKVTRSDVDDVKSLIKKEEGSKLTEEQAGRLNTAIMDADSASKMIELQNTVSALLDENQVLTENADITDAEKKATDLKEQKPKFVEIQTSIIDEAKVQQQAIVTATDKVNSLLKDDHKSAKDEVTRNQLSEATKLVEVIKQEKAKSDLLALTKLVDQYLLKKELAVAKATEETKKAKDAKKSDEVKQVASNSNSSSTSKDSSSKSKSSNGSTSSSGKKSSSNSDKAKDNSKSSSSSGDISSNKSNKSSSDNNKSSDKSNNNKNSGGMKPGDSFQGNITGGGEIGDGGTYEKFTW